MDKTAFYNLISRIFQVEADDNTVLTSLITFNSINVMTMLSECSQEGLLLDIDAVLDSCPLHELFKD